MMKSMQQTLVGGEKRIANLQKRGGETRQRNLCSLKSMQQRLVG